MASVLELISRLWAAFLLSRSGTGGRCYWATQAGNPGVRRFLDRLGIARVANGNNNRLSSQPSQVVK